MHTGKSMYVYVQTI